MTALPEVLEKLERATPGGWKVVEEKLPWSLADGRTGAHTQRRICTEWDHPQLKGPIGITNLAFGIGLHDAERKGVQFVSMSLEDAEAIIAAVNFLREHGHALLASQQYAEANPLGGPASMLETAARRIRAGEDFHEVLADYDLHSGAALLRDAGDGARYRWLREHVTDRFVRNNEHEPCLLLPHNVDYLSPDEIDAAIDAAMHAPGGAG